MTHQEIREKFINFFEEKGHKLVPSSSLLPTDSSVLFTTAGMQQFKPYYTGEADPMKDFSSLNTVSVQKCLRTSDIDEVGDESHLTFFEMLGNFSFGGYFKKETIQYAHEFITKVMGLKIDYVSVFAGEGDIPADTESEKIWKSINPGVVVKRAGRADNFWGPTGDEGPCGPTSEIYVNGIEIWNLVFNQYYQSKNGELEPLKTPGIDTGMGLERLAMIVQGKKNIFETDLFEPLINSDIHNLDSVEIRIKRIILDHARAIAFLISDGVIPSNKERGYVLRRLMRRIITREQFMINKNQGAMFSGLGVLESVVKTHKPFYDKLDKDKIIGVWMDESNKFTEVLNQGFKKFNEFVLRHDTKVGVAHDQGILYGNDAFYLYQSFGFPREVMMDLCKDNDIRFDDAGFEEAIKKHQELSRTASAGMFKGGLADTSEQTTRLHTAAHLMLAGLRKVLGSQVLQKGSNITSERLRFDFNYDGKMTPEQIKQVEDFVNDAIEKKLPVRFEEVMLDEARAMNATGVFDSKYGEKVKVYTIGKGNDIVSREICGGPHVNQTGGIGKFKIVKEESVSAGTRRIRAVLED